MSLRRFSFSVAAVLTAAAIGISPAAALPFGSSSPERVITDAAKDAYSSLPRDMRNNPMVKDQAEQLGLIDKPAPAPAHAPKPAQKPAPAQRAAQDCANCVALTFDDGPAAPTNRLLGVLKKKNAHATFFVTAPNARSMPKTLKRMAGHGHTIGNHGVTHSEMDHMTADKIRSEIHETNAAIKSATGQQAHWFRPPYGAMNDTVTTVARQEGMAVAFWQVDTLDWKFRDPQRTCRVAVDQATAGSIVLMHDIHSTTVDAAACIIDGLRAKGLEPVGLDQMIPNAAPGKVYSRR